MRALYPYILGNPCRGLADLSRALEAEDDILLFDRERGDYFRPTDLTPDLYVLLNATMSKPMGYLEVGWSQAIGNGPITVRGFRESIC